MLERFALFEHLLIDLTGGIGAALDLLRSNLNVEVQEVVVERLAEVGAEDCAAGVGVPEEQAARPSAAMAAIAAREVVVRDIFLRNSWGKLR